MSANSHNPVHSDAAHHDHHASGGHGTYASYITGFVLSVVLTAIPFWLVMGHVLADTRLVAPLIMGLGVIQIIVHMVFFLHMNTKVEGGWSMLAMIFTIVLVVITLSGSIWIMYHLNDNMMPMPAQMPHDMKMQ